MKEEFVSYEIAKELNSIVYIYMLKHPITNEIKYIGKTTNLKRRFYQHKNKKCLEKTASKKLASWILKLLSENLLPIIEVIEECNKDNWSERERYWIAFYKNLGINLCNLSEGGEGVGHNEEIKLKIKNALTGKKRSEEFRKRMSEVKKGSKQSKETVMKRIQKVKKLNENPEHRKKFGRSKPVYQYTLKGEFIRKWKSIEEAANCLNLRFWSIGKCCRKKSNSSGGFFWTYEKLKEEAQEACILKMIEIVKNEKISGISI